MTPMSVRRPSKTFVVVAALSATALLRCGAATAAPVTTGSPKPVRQPEVTLTDAAQPQPPLDECPVFSDSSATDASVTLLSVELGAGSAITQSLNASHEYSVEGDADLRIGGHLVFGDHSSDVGAGVSTDLAAGISLGAGLGYDHLNQSDERSLAQSFQQAKPATTGTAAVLANRPSKVSIDAGVWLNGGIDVSSPVGSASLKAEVTAAIGYDLELTYDSNGNPSITGQAVTFSASGRVDVSGNAKLLGPLGFGAAASAQAEIELAVNMSPSFAVTGFGASLTGTATWGTEADVTKDFTIKDLPFGIGGSISNSRGSAVTYITELDTKDDPAATTALNTMLASMLDTTGGPPPSQADLQAAITLLTPKARSLLFDSRVTEQASATDLKAGDALGFAFEANQTHTQRTTKNAWWSPAGSGIFMPWTACQNALIAPSSASSTTTTTSPTPTTYRPTPTTTPPVSTPPTTQSPNPTPLIVAVDGRIGNIHIGSSTESDIRNAIGAPDAIGLGTVNLPNTPLYRSLGYNCSTNQANGWPSLNSDRPPYCQTIYYLDASSGLLGAFWTASPLYQTAAGTRVGMSSAEAQNREGTPITEGCDTGITLGNRSSTASVYVNVGPASTDAVAYILADSSRHPIGILYC